MAEQLVFDDPYAAADLLTFAGRSSRVGDACVHLQAARGVLVVTAAPLVRQGLLDATPTIMGMRILPVDGELECDIVVESATLAISMDDAARVTLPESAVEPPLWSQAVVPRTGWEDAGALSAGILTERAQWGMSAVAHALPTDPGDPLVQAVRGRVWNEPDPDLHELPRGVAFAASALGFLGTDPEIAPVRRAGRWVRVSLARGHVLLRGPLHMGLTAVRTTGAVSEPAEA